ncbi:MAG: archease [Anaerolineales bacterium]|jgi:SHS2 domain-containing protein
MDLPPFEELEHTADWSLRVHARTIDELFVHAAMGMFSLLDPEFRPQGSETRSLQITAADFETLMVSWLEELLYQLEVERFGADDFDVQINDTSLEAVFKAVPIDSIKKDIKAVTYNELEIVHDVKGFHTTIVFDV